MNHKPDKLGDILAPSGFENLLFNIGMWVQNTVYALLNFALMGAVVALPVWWFLTRPEMHRNIMLILTAILIVLWLIVDRLRRSARRRGAENGYGTHSLLANDRQGFMRDLRLDEKTAVLDGSNIYHFGRENGLDAQPLGEIAHQLRAEGYRIVCFFDANIFYTLSEHGAYASDQRHLLTLLKDIFGLREDEIYVVPSGEQADKYVLDSLKHLPISFAVTNDQFRDYAMKYPTVMKDNQWRKGVKISNNEIRLQQHRFQKPIKLS